VFELEAAEVDPLDRGAHEADPPARRLEPSVGEVVGDLDDLRGGQVDAAGPDSQLGILTPRHRPRIPVR
jgi:hypothetical protein